MSSPAPATSLLDGIRRELDRSLLRTRNGIKHVVGVDRARVGLSPKDTVWQRDKAQLWRYHNPRVRYAPPVVLIMSLVSRSYILDLRPGNSFVEHLLAAGLDVFLLDWGEPDAEESQNTIETYVDGYMPRAVRAACEEAGVKDVTMLGYCLGGILALLYATRRQSRLRNLALMATPVDFDHMGILAGLMREGRVDPDSILDETGNVPPDVIKNGFRVRRPTGDLVTYANLWENLWNDEYVEGYQAMNQWANDHVPFPGAAARQMQRLFVHENRLRKGSLRLASRNVDLSSIGCPVLNIIAEKDDIVPLAAAEPIRELLHPREFEELKLKAGHVALIAGRRAAKETIPAIIDWLVRHSRRLERERRVP